MAAEVDALQGRALDEAVASEVMGLRVVSGWVEINHISSGCPAYSSDGNAMLTLLARLLTLTEQEDIHIEHLAGTGWKVSTCWEVGEWKDWVEAPTLPEAVARAALAAVRAA